jgi:hypothetical protein
MPFAEMKAAARAAGMTDRCEKAESKTGRGQVIGKLLLKSGRGVLHDES